MALSSKTLILKGSLSSLGSLRAGRLKYVNYFPPALSLWAIFRNGLGLDWEKAKPFVNVNLYMLKINK